MINRYRIIFLGLDKSPEQFQKGMASLGVPSRMIKKIMNSAPVILKQGLDLIYAKNYAEAVRSAGGNIQIQKDPHQPKSKSHIKIEPLENFTMCTQCGYKQLKTQYCIRCGRALSP